MSNPRRRRTVIVIVTTAFMLLFQLPNLMRFSGPWAGQHQIERANQFKEENDELNRALRAREIDIQEYARRTQEMVDEQKAANTRFVETAELTARLASIVLPIGWLPIGVMYSALGNPLPAILGFLGMTSIGATCLWRAYRTTLGLYQGRFTSVKVAAAPAVAAVDLRGGRVAARCSKCACRVCRSRWQRSRWAVFDR